MRVLVLNHDVEDHAKRPADEVFECVEGCRGGDRADEMGIDHTDGPQVTGHDRMMPDLGYDTDVRSGLAVLCVLLAGSAGCARDPADPVCPEIGVGDLVITEIGGPQTGADTLKPWVELYNASGATVDLVGVRIRFRRLTGDEIGAAIVRRELSVAAGSYTVLGLDLDDSDQTYLDYGFAADFHSSWPSSAAIDVYACDQPIDQVRYDSLPKTGTYSLGAMPPTEEANDLPAMWCTDATSNADSFPGTPQRANTACP